MDVVKNVVRMLKLLAVVLIVELPHVQPHQAAAGRPRERDPRPAGLQPGGPGRGREGPRPRQAVRRRSTRATSTGPSTVTSGARTPASSRPRRYSASSSRPRIELMLLAQVVSLLISIPLAMYSAYRANSAADKAITTAAFGLISFPNYALAVALVWLFALQLDWFPAIGYKSVSSRAGGQPQIGGAAGQRPRGRPHRRLHAAPAQRPHRHAAGGLRPDGPQQGPPDLAHPRCATRCARRRSRCSRCSPSTSARSSAAP